MRGEHGVVHFVRSWSCLRWQRCPENSVHVHSGLCIDKYDIEWVHSDSGNLCVVSRRQLLR